MIPVNAVPDVAGQLHWPSPLPLPYAAWLSPTTLTPQAQRGFETWLDDDEHRQLHRFVHAQDRDSYRAAHGLMRSLVGAALGCEPSAWSRNANPGHRPTVVGHHLHFSLTHTVGNVAVIVDRTPCGIDTESFSRPIEWDSIAKRYFHPEEVAQLKRSSTPQRDFFALWTLKEAYWKARGLGLSGGLDRVWFTLMPEIISHFPPEDSQTWRIGLGELPSGYWMAWATQASAFPEGNP